MLGTAPSGSARVGRETSNAQKKPTPRGIPLAESIPVRNQTLSSYFVWILSRWERGGPSNGINSVDSADYFASGRGACMAIQPQLGLWTKRRDRFNPCNRAHSIVAQSVLT
jgi:hypothetical protein